MHRCFAMSWATIILAARMRICAAQGTMTIDSVLQPGSHGRDVGPADTGGEDVLGRALQTAGRAPSCSHSASSWCSQHDIDRVWGDQLAELVPDPAGGTAQGVCNDAFAQNYRHSEGCAYDCSQLKRIFFAEEAFSPRIRCFLYNASTGTWPPELLERKSTEAIWKTYAVSAGVHVENLTFVVGKGTECRNVTLATIDQTGRRVHTRETCLFDGQHEINHTVPADHSIEVTTGQDTVIASGLRGNTTQKFVIGKCTDIYVQIDTAATSSSPNDSVHFRIEEFTGRHGPWWINSTIAELGTLHKFYTCMYDSKFTIQLVSTSSSWTGNVSVVGWLTDNTITIPKDEKWIVQGYSTNGVAVTLDARLASGSPADRSNASLVLRHVRLSGQHGTLDRWDDQRAFSRVANSRMGCAFYYEGGFGSSLLFDHVIFDHNGGASCSGSAMMIAGRAEENSGWTPTRYGVNQRQNPPSWNCSRQGCGLELQIDSCLFWQNAGTYSTIRTININPLQMVVQNSAFRDNRALVGSAMLVTWYPGMFNKTGVHNVTIRKSTFQRTEQCTDANKHNPFVSPEWFCDGRSIAPVGFYAFPGGTSRPDHLILLNFDEISAEGYQENFYNFMLISAFNTEEAPVTLMLSNSNFSNMIGMGLANEYQNVWLDIKSPKSRSYYLKNRWHNNTVKPGTESRSTAVGAALYVLQTGMVTVKSNEFVGNIASSGGAIGFNSQGRLELISCLFYSNVAYVRGGAVLFSGSPTSSGLLVQESIFANNVIKVPAARKEAINVQLYTGGAGWLGPDVTTGLFPIWRIDGQKPWDGCNSGLPSDGTGGKRARKADGSEVCPSDVIDGDVGENETIYGSNKTADTKYYLADRAYSQIIYLTPGKHRLWYGVLVDTPVETQGWIGGWIAISGGVLDRIYVSIPDFRVRENHNKYIRYPGCYSGHKSTAGADRVLCPSGVMMWQYADFVVRYGEGGAISTSAPSSISILNTTFAYNRAGNGHAASVIAATSLDIVDTSFHPNLPSPIQSTVSSSKCNSTKYTMCKRGQHCMDRLSSLHCENNCRHNEIGNGKDCVQCPQGKGPNTLQTACETCAPNEKSLYGVCSLCPQGRVPSPNGATCDACGQQMISNGSACVKCPPGHQPASDGVTCESCLVFGGTQYSVDGQQCKQCPSGSVSNINGTACACEPGRYDASNGIVTCVDNNWKPDMFSSNTEYSVAYNQLLEHRQQHHALQCIACPSCLDCLYVDSTDYRVKAGFSLATSTTATLAKKVDTILLRCNVQINSDESSVQDSTTNPGLEAYNLSTEEDSNLVCLGGTMHDGLKCRHGHTGILCSSCEEGFGKKQGPCVPCQETIKAVVILQIMAAILAMCLISGILLIGLSFAIGDVYETLEIDNAKIGHVANPMYDKKDSSAAAFADDENTENREPECEQDADSRKFNKARQQITGVVRVVTKNAILRSCKRLLLSFIGIGAQPFRIFLSYWQIAGQLTTVLHFKLPSMISGIFATFQPFVANISGLIALECAGLRNWYTSWLFQVIVIPISLWTLTLGFFLYRRQYTNQNSTVNPVAMLQDDAFLVLFIVYPFVTNRLFVVLNCRQLNEFHSVLVDDYNSSCDTDVHFWYRTAAVIAIVVFSLGVPAGLIVIMLRHKHSQLDKLNSPSWQFVARKAMIKLDCGDLQEIKNTMIAVLLSKRYGSIVSAYKPGLFFFECIEMIRKLILVGVLALVPVGSSLQTAAGLVCSFLFFAAHIHFMPLRFWEDNLLKATTEVHLFIVFLLVLTLKTQPSGEVAATEEYDIIASITFVIMVPVTTIVCIILKWRTVVTSAAHNKDLTKTELLKTAFKRHLIGRDKDEVSLAMMLNLFIDYLVASLTYLFICCWITFTAVGPQLTQ